MKAKLLIVYAIATVVFDSARTAYGTDQVVTDPGDNGGANQLRAKITAAQSSGGGTITFNLGPAIIVLSGGVLPNITTNIVIDGGSLVTLSGNNATPVFQIFSPGALTLNNLTVTAGFNSGGNGGAIGNGSTQGNGGTLNINNCKFLSNKTAAASSGGAIVTYGPLNVSNSEFASNIAGNGGAIFPRFAPAVTNIIGSTFHDNQAVNQTNGWGGAMLLWDGAPVTVDHSTFRNNSAMTGGALYIFPNSSLTLTYSTVDANSATAVNGTSAGPGNGGGIYNGASLTISNSTISANSARGGNSTQTVGGSANGGGIYNAGTLTLSNSTVSGNIALGGAGGTQPVGGIPEGIRGGSVSGAGLWNNNTATLTNCTFFANTATGGIGGGGIVDGGGTGGNGLAGGVYNDATLTVTNCTLAGNSAVGGSGGKSTAIGGSNGANGNGQGGGILQDATGANNLRNNLIATNSATAAAPDASGTFNSQGNNLVGQRDGGTGFTATGDKTGTTASPLDPQLDPNGRQDNGGPTKTVALEAGSPAIDAGTSNGAPAKDQRGLARNGPADIGAFEFAGLLPVSLGNISTRGQVGIGDEVMIGGFIITGTSNKLVLLRAIGPSLSSPPINLTGTLQDPTLSLFSGNTRIEFNDNWAQAANAGSIPPGLQPSNPLESAILISLAPGAYTAIVSGLNAGTGIGLVEVFDLDATVPSKLTNISTRGLVETGDSVLIGGFIVKGPDNETVVVRAKGPSLSDFGLTNVLQNPTLSLFNDQGTRIQFNDDWQSDQRDQIIATGLQPSNNAESAMITTLMPGNYTAIVNGLNGTTGLALVEVFGRN